MGMDKAYSHTGIRGRRAGLFMGEEGFSLLPKKVNGGSQQNGEHWQVSSLVPFFRPEDGANWYSYFGKPEILAKFRYE